jgi:hypothetical protein
MLTHRDPSALRAGITAAFPGADLNTHPIDFGPTHLRFELGDKHPNGTDERIVQATERAAVIFAATFLEDELLTLVIKNWDWSGREICPSTPGHLATLISCPVADQFAQVITERRSDGEDYCYEQILLPALVRDLDCRSILRGIAHLEQGREPRINESIYFVSTRRAMVFYMYDDRGCLVFADHPEKLRPLYLTRRSWLVGPDHPGWERMFHVP